MATFGNLVAAPGGQFSVAEYTEISYNRQRSHSQLGYLTPAEALTHYQWDNRA
jgi:transposase InsO family protein